jgi:hypothetical protein
MPLPLKKYFLAALICGVSVFALPAYAEDDASLPTLLQENCSPLFDKDGLSGVKDVPKKNDLKIYWTNLMYQCRLPTDAEAKPFEKATESYGKQLIYKSMPANAGVCQVVYSRLQSQALTEKPGDKDYASHLSRQIVVAYSASFECRPKIKAAKAPVPAKEAVKEAVTAPAAEPAKAEIAAPAPAPEPAKAEPAAPAPAPEPAAAVPEPPKEAVPQ